jgi:(R)-2-hydroxyacyl-CoA dehydratese activating ATPase
MLYRGIDVGAQSVKAVVFDKKEIIGWKVLITEEDADTAARHVYEDLLGELGIEKNDIQASLATGWGASAVSFTDGKSSEQICSARGARWLFPAARTVVDIGAEGCRVMKLDANGVTEDFATNSKCASGTGAFIELGAVYLQVPIDQMGALSLAADGVAEVSSTCAVFAESSIISNIHRGDSKQNIAAGVHRAVAIRIMELIGRMGTIPDVVLVGGTAMNAGLVKALEQMAGVTFRIPEQPRIVGALGAAIQASLKKGKTASGDGA